MIFIFIRLSFRSCISCVFDWDYLLFICLNHSCGLFSKTHTACSNHESQKISQRGDCDRDSLQQVTMTNVWRHFDFHDNRLG